MTNLAKQKKVIWTNDVQIQDFEDCFQEEGIVDEAEKYKRMYELIDMYFEDELINLDKELPGNILVIADLGLWNGRRPGYRELGNNLNNILKVAVGDYFTVYCDGDDIRATDIHHDGTNHYLFRLIRDDENIDILKKKIFDDTFTTEDIEQYTISLAPFVKEIYGW